MTGDHERRLAINLDRFYEIVKRAGREPTGAELAAASAWVEYYHSRTHHGGDFEWMAGHLGMSTEQLGERFEELWPYRDWREA